MRLGLVLGIVASVGVVATAITTHYCTLSAEKILAETKREEFKAVWKNYIPAFLIGALSIGCIFGSIHASKRALLAAGAGASYVAANKDKIAEKAEPFIQKMRNMYAESNYSANDLQTVELTGDGDLLCYDVYSGRWFRSSQEAVEGAIRAFNKELDEHHYANLNNLYKHLGIMPTHFGCQYGYVKQEGYYEDPIDIYTELVEDGEVEYTDMLGSILIPRNEPVLCINFRDFNQYPMEGYLEI